MKAPAYGRSLAIIAMTVLLLPFALWLLLELMIRVVPE